MISTISPKALVTVIILYFNDKENIENCIKSVISQTYKQLQVICIDNNTGDGLIDVLIEKYSKVEFIKTERNLGFCGANNLGIKISKGDYLLFLNSDILLKNNYVEIIINEFQKDSQIGLISGKLLRFDFKTIDSRGLFLTKKFTLIDRGAGKIDNGLDECREEIFGCCGAAFFISRTAYNLINYNNELFDDLFFAFMEDGDASYRIHLFGFKVIYLPDAIAFHKRGVSSTGEGNYKFFKKNNYYRYLSLRNRYYFIIKNLSVKIVLSNLMFFMATEIFVFLFILVHPKLFAVYKDVIKNFQLIYKKRKYQSKELNRIKIKEYNNWKISYLRMIKSYLKSSL